MRHAGGDDHAAGRQRHAALAQRPREAGRRGLGQPPLQLADREVEQRAVLRHDCVEEIDPGEDLEQIVQIAASDQEQLATARLEPLQRCDRALQGLPVGRERLIVVCGQGDEAHVARGRGSRG